MGEKEDPQQERIRTMRAAYEQVLGRQSSTGKGMSAPGSAWAQEVFGMNEVSAALAGAPGPFYEDLRALLFEGHRNANEKPKVAPPLGSNVEMNAHQGSPTSPPETGIPAAWVKDGSFAEIGSPQEMAYGSLEKVQRSGPNDTPGSDEEYEEWGEEVEEWDEFALEEKEQSGPNDPPGAVFSDLPHGEKMALCRETRDHQIDERMGEYTSMESWSEWAGEIDATRIAVENSDVVSTYTSQATMGLVGDANWSGAAEEVGTVAGALWDGTKDMASKMSRTHGIQTYADMATMDEASADQMCTDWGDQNFDGIKMVAEVAAGGAVEAGLGVAARTGYALGKTALKAGEKGLDGAKAVRNAARGDLKAPLSPKELAQADAHITSRPAGSKGERIAPDEVEGLRTHTSTDGANADVVPPSSRFRESDFTPDARRHEAGHRVDLKDPAVQENIDRLNTTQRKMSDEGLDFRDLSDKEKLQYHRDIDVFEGRQLERDVDYATMRMSDPDISPAEARHWENELAGSAAERDRLDSRASAKLDENGELTWDEKTQGGMGAGWLDEEPSVYLPKGQNTKYQRFINSSPEEQLATKARINKALDDGDMLALHAEGYREINGVITRPQGLTDDFPAAQKVGDQVMRAPDGKRKLAVKSSFVDEGAKAFESPLDLKNPTTNELQHSKKQIGGLKERLGISDQEAELTLEQVFSARQEAQAFKSKNPALSKGERADLDSLRERTPTDRTPEENARFNLLNKRSEDLSKAHADMVGASEILGEEAAYALMKNEGYELVHSGTGSGTFDQIWVDPKTDKIYIVEAKGGSATNSSSRKMTNGEHHQQGTPTYKEAVWDVQLEKMEERSESLLESIKTESDPKLLAEAKREHASLERALDAMAGTKVKNADYLMLSQRLDAEGLGTASKKTFGEGRRVVD